MYFRALFKSGFLSFSCAPALFCHALFFVYPDPCSISDTHRQRDREGQVCAVLHLPCMITIKEYVPLYRSSTSFLALTPRAILAVSVSSGGFQSCQHCVIFSGLPSRYLHFRQPTLLPTFLLPSHCYAPNPPWNVLHFRCFFIFCSYPSSDALIVFQWNAGSLSFRSVECVNYISHLSILSLSRNLTSTTLHLSELSPNGLHAGDEVAIFVRQNFFELSTSFSPLIPSLPTWCSANRHVVFYSDLTS